MASSNLSIFAISFGIADFCLVVFLVLIYRKFEKHKELQERKNRAIAESNRNLTAWGPGEVTDEKNQLPTSPRFSEIRSTEGTLRDDPIITRKEIPEVWDD
mmetsp:Transcript_55466/g.63370  ORF Transcript_55466/g.63370 Transcript_55466/m.63370 type:complete len:101 (-) Transcript_55466:59-361(-)